MAAPNLAVYVLFYEKVNQTIKCVESFLPSGVQIYILNNGSTKSSREALDKYCEKHTNIKIFDFNNNLGASLGRNYLIEHTNEEWLLFVDNDIYVEKKDWLGIFKRYLQLYPDIDVFIPRLFLTLKGRYNRYFRWEIKERDGIRKIYRQNIIEDLTNNFPGGASFINRKVFDRLGLYDKEIFIGFEDYEFCARAIISRKPIKAMLIHDITLVHDHRPVRNDVDKKAVLKRYDSRIIEGSINRIFEKHKIILNNKWRIWVIIQKYSLTGHYQRKIVSLFFYIQNNFVRIMNKVSNVLKKRPNSFSEQ